jgi:Flp pilus assembly protein TadD
VQAAPVQAAAAAAPTQEAVAPELPRPRSAASTPSWVRYQELLGQARKLGFRRDAEAAYLKALAADPKGVEALSGLAMLYLNRGNNLQAKERAEQALALGSNDAEAWIVLGAAQSALGKRTEAREAYARCAALPGGGKYVTECKRMLR